jgi:polynucleotide 5'-kinase involved in rRNA processing
MDFPPHGQVWRWFVGSTSPAGHMLSVLAGAARLVQAARTAGAQVVIYDTSGLVEPSAGGAALKFAKVELLQPSTIFAIQKEEELQPILHPLRRARRQRLVVLEPSVAVHRRDAAERQAHRAGQFSKHFQAARPLMVSWSRLAVFPYPQFALHRLLAFQDEAGFSMALGIVRAIDRPAHQVEILTPLASLERVSSIHIGDLFLDPLTFQDRRI